MNVVESLLSNKGTAVWRIYPPQHIYRSVAPIPVLLPKIMFYRAFQGMRIRLASMRDTKGLDNMSKRYYLLNVEKLKFGTGTLSINCPENAS